MAVASFEEDFIPVDTEDSSIAEDGWTRDAVKVLASIVFSDMQRYNSLNCHEKRRVSYFPSKLIQ